MTNRDIDPLVTLGDVPAAIGLLTRLPMRVDTDAATARGATAAWAYPLVGLVVGGLAGLVGMIALTIGLSAGVAAMLVIGAQIIVTGALHEDGLADTADGFWGGWDTENRLHIMKDSAIGTYGVLALILIVGLRWTALTAIMTTSGFGGALVTAAVLSRAAMPVLMHMLPNARQSGLSRAVGRPARVTAGISTVIGIATALVLTGASVVLMVIVTTAVTCACAWIAYRKIKGQTGDVLGATQQICETACLIASAALLAS